MLSKVDRIICETQGNIFRCANMWKFDMDVFVPVYMKSYFCEHCMDTIYSPFQMADPEECLDIILEEITVPKLKDVKYNPQILEWIGFTYRHLYFYSNKKSREIIDKVPFIDMLIYYPGLSTVDEDIAVEIIYSDKF